MQRLVTTVAFIFFYIGSFSQQFGGTPPSQKWKQIDTDSVRVIFPVGLDSQANRVASVVHWMASQKPVALGEKLKKVDIVLQHQTTVSNAYVGLGPFRSEFYLTPDPSNFEPGSLSWIDLLSVHEYRHVQQFNNFNNGISKTMKTLFGEDGYALAINAAVPEWFFEGDAVYMETWMSNQGRGRLSLFTNAFPSLWKSEKKYSWMKMRNGSMKDYVPNHYNLGYLLVNYGYEKYGNDFWSKVTRDASAYKSLIYPFQAAIKKHAGVDYEKFRKDAYGFYHYRFDSIEVATGKKSLTQSREIFPVQKKYVTSYYYPFQAGEDSLIYMKSSYRHLPAFYIKDASGEHKIKLKDISTDNHFSYRNGKIVYASFHSDARWGWRDYSVIQLLDVQSGEQRTLTHKTKYFTPDISLDGNRVAAIQQSINGKSELHILDASTGELIKSIQSSDISLFTDPRFIDDSSIVTAVRLQDGKMALALAEIETGNTMRLTNPSFNVVGNPSVDNGIIFFTASYEGNDDVFAIRLSDKKTFRITQGPFGNYYPNAGFGKLTWSTFTADGYQLRQVDLKDIIWDEVTTNNVEILNAKFAPGSNALQQNLVENLPTRNFPNKDYSKSTGLINFHSWRPNYSDPVFSFSIYGQNVLNTLQTELYYLYHSDEKTNAVGFNTTFSQLFPFIILGSEYTFNRQGLMSGRTRTWDQLDSRLGLVLPLRSTSGKTYKNFSLGSYYVLRNEFNKGFFKDSIGNTTFSYLLHTINWIQQLPRAMQHIYPRWAYSLTGNYRHAISYYDGYQLYGNAAVYVPGVMASHNLIISGTFQQRDTSRLLFSNRFAGARGYEDYYGTVAGSRLTRLSADYHLPLLYPDFGFANILYIQRFRANLFYDLQKIYSNSKKNSAELRSAGAEFYVDTKWWNQYPLTFGVRFSRLLDDDPLARLKKGATIFEFLVPVNIIPR